MNVTVKPHHKMAGVYSVELETGNTSLATLNLTPGKTVYGERLVEDEGREYRLWDPYKSKLAAAILKKLPNMPINPSCVVLYLGAASGTTVSHISDIVGARGHVYAVEFSPRSLRELISNLSSRMNVFPILADARTPSHYRPLVEKVEVVYCDIAQPEQARVLADNADTFLKEEGSALLAIKARSIDSARKPEKVFREEVNVLKKRGLSVKAMIPLEPYDRDHAMALAEK
ncbi:MAG: fibrillarin-like rRNA/tRNA 2'-O-methyltransferase [Candidatus Bathyarchaeota archaeon]